MFFICSLRFWEEPSSNWDIATRSRVIKLTMVKQLKRSSPILLIETMKQFLKINHTTLVTEMKRNVQKLRKYRLNRVHQASHAQANEIHPSHVILQLTSLGDQQPILDLNNALFKIELEHLGSVWIGVIISQLEIKYGERKNIVLIINKHNTGEIHCLVAGSILGFSIKDGFGSIRREFVFENLSPQPPIVYFQCLYDE